MKAVISAVLGILLVFPLAAIESSLPEETGACQDVYASSGCRPSIPPDPEWQRDMETARKEGEACQPDIEKFCEGVQVGEGRIEACLKAHKRKLSKECRKVQGLTK